MIYGHHFDFQSEPKLINGGEPFVVDNGLRDPNKTIPVIEMADYPFPKAFPLIGDWLEMSGEEARYCSMAPFESASKDLCWALDIKDTMTLIWEGEERTIYYIKKQNYTPKKLRFWIFHTFFAIILEMERTYRILHAGSVEIEGRPVLFSAFSFGGKSTLTAFFVGRGHTMLSDDAMGIDKRPDGYYAIASYPFQRPYREPGVLGDPIQNFSTLAKPLRCIYLLDKSEPDATISISEVTGIKKFKAFHYSSFVSFGFMKEERFGFFTEMANHIPVYKVTLPWDRERLQDVYEAILSNETAHQTPSSKVENRKCK